jgi:hypothetical protein
MPDKSNKIALNYTYLFSETRKCHLLTIGTLKIVPFVISMEYDQWIISRFLFNERLDAHQIAEGSATKFGEDAYLLKPVQIRMEEVKTVREYVHDMLRSTKPREADLTAKI